MDEFLGGITTCIKLIFTSFIITLEEVFICQSGAVCPASKWALRKIKNISKLQKHHVADGPDFEKKITLKSREPKSHVCRCICSLRDRLSLHLCFNSQYVSFKLGTYLMSRPALRLPRAHKGRTEGQLRLPSFKSCPCKWDVLLTLAAPQRAIYAIAE